MKAKPTSQKLSLTPPKPAGKKKRTPTSGPDSSPPDHRARQKAGRKAPDNRGLSATREYAEAFEAIRGLAAGIQELNQRAVEAYTPVVEAIVRSAIPDTRHIEHTLDGLLDFCCYEPALHLYKKLCRYYFDIDPTATVGYIEAYREMWDSDAEAKPGVSK